MVLRDMEPFQTQYIVVKLLHLTNKVDTGGAREAEGGGDFGAQNLP